MKVVIFGATGNVGQHMVHQGLALGHTITAFTRDKVRLIEAAHKNLKIHEGDILDEKAVKEAIDGQDAVICALGAGRKGTIRSEGTFQIIRAMRETGVKRLIVQSTLGAGDSRNNLDFFWKHIMFGLFLKDAYQDHQTQEKYVMESGLDWTIVRPGAFTDGDATGQFKHGFSPEDKSIKLKISKADIAMFVLSQLKTEQYLHQTPGLSY